MSFRADVYGEEGLDRLIAKAEALDGPAQIAKEAKVAVKVVELLYKGGYALAQAPSGDGWKPRKRSYPHPPLQKSEKMKDDTKIVAEADGIRITIPAPYAEYQHGGTRTIDARPLVPETDLGTWDAPINLARRAVGYDLE